MDNIFLIFNNMYNEYNSCAVFVVAYSLNVLNVNKISVLVSVSCLKMTTIMAGIS
jgi:hypothetical protein